MKLVGMIMAGALGASAATAAPLVGPWPVKNPSEVLVLGSPHLSGIEHVQQAWMEPLLERLAAWTPQIIAIEALSGPECYLLRRYERSWPDTANGYCKRVERIAALAETVTGLDMPGAEAAAEAAVAKLGPSSTPGERRRAAALFAAAGNLGSAATQWLRLSPGERRGEEVSAELGQALDQLAVARNENFWIAAALAARLGLERIYPTDDHLSDRVQAEAPPGLEAALTAIWSGERPAMALQAQAMETSTKSGADVLGLYRFMNRRAFGEMSVRADMGKAFGTPSPGEHGRRYVAWWETRNLRQVANIRAAMAAAPGARTLVVVGSTHKPYFDAYLQMMHEVRLVPTERVLGR